MKPQISTLATSALGQAFPSHGGVVIIGLIFANGVDALNLMFVCLRA